MARNYASGTASSGSASATAALLMAAARDAAVANSAWSLVEEVSNASYQCIVLKCAAAQSGLAADFFVLLTRNISNGSISMSVGESYNTGTKVFVAAPETNSATTIAFDTNGIPTVQPTITIPTMATANAPSIQSMSSPVATQFWQMLVSEDSISFQGIGSVAAGFTIGAFTPFLPADVQPVIAIGWEYADNYPSSSSVGAKVLRLPPGIEAQSPQPRYEWGVYAPSVTILKPGTYAGSSIVNDRMLGGRPPAWEILVAHNVAKAPTIGCIRGKYKKTLALDARPGGIAYGDDIPIDGTKWKYWGANTSGIGIILDSGIAV